MIGIASDVGVVISGCKTDSQEAGGLSAPPPDTFILVLTNVSPCLDEQENISCSSSLTDISLSGCSSPHTPEHLQDAHDSVEDDIWTMVHKHRRGQHPRKRVFP